MHGSSRTRPRPVRQGALAILCAAALLWAADARAYTRTFSAGSLIIPAQMEYQTDCGMTSAYGLIYWILYKNQTLAKPITVHWVIEPRKLSHHRCYTGDDTLPSYSTPNDNDGCDVAVQNADGQPVARLGTSNAEEEGFDVSTLTYSTTTGNFSRTGTTQIDEDRKVTKYSGGLWVIDASERQAALNLFLNDPDVHRFRTGDKACTFPYPATGGGSHHVEVHSARISFTASVARMINVKPGRIALLDAGAVTILKTYLRNAGLVDIPNAGGTPEEHGVIYDTLTPVLDFTSSPTYPNGALNAPDPEDSTRKLYEVMWAPHWESDRQSTLPRDGDLGDSIIGDARWTYYDSVTATHDDAITNGLKNVALFSEGGNGVFAECASIESFEGSYNEGNPGCSGTYECECTDAAMCSFGATQPFACSAGYTSGCGGCYQCSAGYTLDFSNCGQPRCISETNRCDPGYSWVSCGSTSGCLSCNAGWTLDTSSCPGSPAVCRRPGRQPRTPNYDAVNYVLPTSDTASCDPGFSRVCIADPGDIDLEGVDATRFQVTNRVQKNGLGWPYVGPDCTDRSLPSGSRYRSTSTGDCIDFHADTGGPSNIFAQKSNFNYSGTWGHIEHYLAPASVGSYYRPGVLQFATSQHPSNASRRGWDFITIRHKDNDPSKGMVVYLAGHTYEGNVAGNRFVLNTLLNLGFSDAGLELARSEPVGYITRDIDPSTGQWVIDSSTKQPRVIARTVFQGTYIQRPPPGPFQDWLNYNSALPQSWRFPYIDGHLRAYDLDKISTAKQDFRSNSLWDAGTMDLVTKTMLPLPRERQIGTVLKGKANSGWVGVEMKYTQTQPGCVSSGVTDDDGAQICALSYELGACGTAGVTQALLEDGDSSGTLRKKLGLFVQQVRGHCAARDDTTSEPIYEPGDGQCDDLKQQKNRAKLGGVDHSSPAVVGPSRYIGNDASTGIKWALRPVVAYVGGRDGMLHAIYVSGSAWAAEGESLPAGIAPGTELWAFLPPGQLCGLATNSAMVDGVMNVVDVFGNFPRDANGDGVFDLSSTAEKPDGIRRWRTVLIGAAGQGGAGLFAPDITNPLKPALLWDLAGARENGGTFDASDPRTYVWKYSNPTGSVNAKTSDEQPAVKTALHDYRNLGLTYGTAVGLLWRGNAYRHVAYVATSAADYSTAIPLGYKGIELYAIDLVSGAKVWHWENLYKVATDGAPGVGTNVIADNTIPGRPALVDVDQNGTVDRVYVGDMEGRMWELDASSGKNVNFLRDEASERFFALPFYGTPPMDGGDADNATKDLFRPHGSTALAQQPLTSPIGIGRLTSVPCNLYKYLEGRLDVAQGTMGVDWAIGPYERGNVFVLPASPESATVRLKNASCDHLTGDIEVVDTREREINVSTKPSLRTRGVLLSDAEWRIPLGTGERLFGMPKLVGNDILIDTSMGSFTGDISETAADEGTTLLVNANKPAGEAIATIGKAFGGALIMDDSVVVTSATGMTRVDGKITPPDGTESAATTPRNRYSPASFGTWEERPNEPRP